MILKLKRTPGIYLVGFMGCGKTTLGRLLADRLGWRFADTDTDIEESQKTSIAEIFSTRGEAEFRRLEYEALRARVQSIECGRPAVVALGGGAFVQPDNYALIENNGVSIWIDCPFPVIRQRALADPSRPLAQDPAQFAKLFEERCKIYRLADFRIEPADDPSETIERIMALPAFQ